MSAVRVLVAVVLVALFVFSGDSAARVFMRLRSERDVDSRVEMLLSDVSYGYGHYGHYED